MTNGQYSGLNRDAGGTVSDMEHIRQSVTDILTTPKGTRLMLRDYGSDLPDLVDGPLNSALRLRVISATYSALAQWEPRLSVSAVSAESAEGQTVITIRGYRSGTQTPVTVSATLTNKRKTRT